MKWFLHKNKKMLLFLIIIVLFIAGFLDIKYEGLVFRLLPISAQSFLADIFSV